MTDILTVIARMSFRPAATMPQLPHEYSIRGRTASPADYDALSAAIRARGVTERWNAKRLCAGEPLTLGAGAGRPARYLYPGDGWRYWQMGPTINRNLVTEAERLRAEGFIS